MGFPEVLSTFSKKKKTMHRLLEINAQHKGTFFFASRLFFREKKFWSRKKVWQKTGNFIIFALEINTQIRGFP